jgi:hypothetical protein
VADHPFRPEQDAHVDPELARLAEQGERRIAARKRAPHAPTPDEQRAIYVRQALGAYHGSPARRLARASLAAALLGPVAIGLAFRHGGAAALAAAIGVFVVGLVASLVLASVKALATPATVAAEQQWIASLPFAVTGYFELLGAVPLPAGCVLVVELAWSSGQPPEPSVVHGVAGLWDPGARVVPRDDGLELRSGRIVTGYFYSGMVETVETFGQTAPNKRVVASVHRLVDKVLLPLHASHAIARISLAQDELR